MAWGSDGFLATLDTEAFRVGLTEAVDHSPYELGQSAYCSCSAEILR